MKTKAGFIFCDICDSACKELNAILHNEDTIAICHSCLKIRQSNNHSENKLEFDFKSSLIQKVEDIVSVDLKVLTMNGSEFIDRSTIRMIEKKLLSLISEIRDLKDET